MFWAPVQAGLFLCSSLFSRKPLLCSVFWRETATPDPIKWLREAQPTTSNHTPMIQPRYETWEHDVSVEYDAEDKERDPYSSPLVVREVAYSGKRAIGPDTASFRPAKMRSEPTVRMLMRQEYRAPIPTEEKIPLAPLMPTPLESPVSRGQPCGSAVPSLWVWSGCQCETGKMSSR